MMFYKVVFWIMLTLGVLVALGFAYLYVMACVMGMPDCII